MEKEQFEKLTPEQQHKVLDTYLNIVKTATYTRMGLLPSISGLFTTFLVIATFSEKLIPLDNTVRVLLCILIILTPLSLWAYNFDLKRAGRKGKAFVENLIGKIEVEQTKLDKVLAYLPDILIYILTIVSVVVIYKILSCFWSVCSNFII